jgi:hypothetical protein
MPNLLILNNNFLTFQNLCSLTFSVNVTVKTLLARIFLLNMLIKYY